jgi:hypothetical protein
LLIEAVDSLHDTNDLSDDLASRLAAAFAEADGSICSPHRLVPAISYVSRPLGATRAQCATLCRRTDSGTPHLNADDRRRGHLPVRGRFRLVRGGEGGARGAPIRGLPGLRSKAFTSTSPASGRSTSTSGLEEAAKMFFNDQLVERVTDLYGVRPIVEFVEIIAFVDNRSSDATA